MFWNRAGISSEYRWNICGIFVRDLCDNFRSEQRNHSSRSGASGGRPGATAEGFRRTSGCHCRELPRTSGCHCRELPEDFRVPLPRASGGLPGSTAEDILLVS